MQRGAFIPGINLRWWCQHSIRHKLLRLGSRCSRASACSSLESRATHTLSYLRSRSIAGFIFVTAAEGIWLQEHSTKIHLPALAHWTQLTPRRSPFCHRPVTFSPATIDIWHKLQFCLQDQRGKNVGSKPARTGKKAPKIDAKSASNGLPHEGKSAPERACPPR